ncbi:MAG: FAD-dependent monooxygenase [Acidobacteriia bacterium]|nr:FAD-dependent monooxygenase [Terriglobia bacterium]
MIRLEQDQDGVTATLSHDGRQERIRCGYLVAADGGKSFVRKHLEVPFEGETWKDEPMWETCACADWTGMPGIPGRIIRTDGLPFVHCLPSTSSSFRPRSLPATNANPPWIYSGASWQNALAVWISK